ncbi:MAG: hypothetical protein ABIQ70_03400 [Dokdonella sp.]
MSTVETILEPRRRTAVAALEAMHALSMSHTDGDVERALDYLRAPRLATKSLYVFDSALAARLAAALIATGLWFECEQLDREKWYFAVAPAGYRRLVALHDALPGPRALLERETLRSPLLLEAGGRIHS